MTGEDWFALEMLWEIDKLLIPADMAKEET